jgi:hypothetical protein
LDFVSFSVTGIEEGMVVVEEESVAMIWTKERIRFYTM